MGDAGPNAGAGAATEAAAKAATEAAEATAAAKAATEAAEATAAAKAAANAKAATEAAKAAEAAKAKATEAATEAAETGTKKGANANPAAPPPGHNIPSSVKSSSSDPKKDILDMMGLIRGLIERNLGPKDQIEQVLNYCSERGLGDEVKMIRAKMMEETGGVQTGTKPVETGTGSGRGTGTKPVETGTGSGRGTGTTAKPESGEAGSTPDAIAALKVNYQNLLEKIKNLKDCDDVKNNYLARGTKYDSVAAINDIISSVSTATANTTLTETNTMINNLSTTIDTECAAKKEKNPNLILLERSILDLQTRDCNNPEFTLEQRNIFIENIRKIPLTQSVDDYQKAITNIIKLFGIACTKPITENL